MRTISATSLAELAKNQGTEPTVILDIQWSDDGNVKRYGDIAIPAHRVSGTIQEVSGLDNVITISGVSQGTSGDSQQLSVVLADVDGTIKDILDSTDVHKQPVEVYLLHRGLDFSERFLLFNGQVSSPIEWHESDRTVRFDVIQQIEDVEYGFSIEEGDFDYVDPRMIGKAWPLCFGTPRNVPALQTRSPYQGILKTGFGIYDWTLEAKLEQLRNVCCPTVFRGWYIRLTLAGQEAIPVFAQEPGCYCRRQAQITAWEEELALQKQHSIKIGSTVSIINGREFPQNKFLWISVCGDARLYGKFTGDTFTIHQFQHPQRGELTVPPVLEISSCGARSENFLPEPENTGGSYNSRDQVLFHITKCGDENADQANHGWDYLATFPTANFFWAEPGCEVLLEGTQDIAYICNILPSTVLRVAAMRTFEGSGIRQLVTVPNAYYSTRLSNFGTYTITEVVLNKPLSYRGEGYEDDIYVTLRSSVGPNTVDILEWLINKYTSFNIDATTFNAVKAQLSDKYPMDFPLLKRGNIIKLLRDIAFQQRCALILRNNTFYLIYLADEPTVDFTITEDDVLPGSFILTHTETEELVTKFVAEWKDDHFFDEPNKAIYRYNIPRYGTQEQTFDFFAFKYPILVEKSATFWLIRMSNTWRKIRCRTPITKLQAEVFDIAGVTLPDLSSSQIKCFVEGATYNSDTSEIDFELWTPIRSGETEPYVFAWPANIEVTNIYPSVSDVEQGKAGGTGPNVDVTPPSSHPLAAPQGFTATFKERTNCGRIAGQVSDHTGCRTDHGDSQPSDIDDQKPTDDNPGEGEGNIGTAKNPIGKAPEWISNQFTDKTEAEARNNESTDNNNPNSGDGGGGDADVDPWEDLEDGPPEDCYGAVRLCMGVIDRVWTGSGYSTTPGVCGEPQWGVTDIDASCSWIYLNSIDAAKQMGDDLDAQGLNGCVGDWGINSGLTGFINSASKWGPDCEEPDPEDQSAIGKDAAGDASAWEAAKDVLNGL